MQLKLFFIGLLLVSRLMRLRVVSTLGTVSLSLQENFNCVLKVVKNFAMFVSHVPSSYSIRAQFWRYSRQPVVHVHENELKLVLWGKSVYFVCFISFSVLCFGSIVECFSLVSLPNGIWYASGFMPLLSHLESKFIGIGKDWFTSSVRHFVIMGRGLLVSWMQQYAHEFNSLYWNLFSNKIFFIGI
jgi:hypothetical protein